MWRDELQAWLIARDSATLSDLLRNLKYEGHPALWHLLLMLLKNISHSPEAMQFLHVAISTATVFVFVKYSPFTKIQKLLFSFGYYSFFEYSIISRNYGIGILLIFIFCTIYKSRYKHAFWIGVSLFLLSHVNVFGLIVVIAVSSAMIVDFFHSRNRYDTSSIIAGFSLIFLGITTSILQIIPPPDSGYAPGWQLDFDFLNFSKTIGALRNAYLPVQNHILHFWNSNIFNDYNLQFASSLLVVLIIAFSCVIFFRYFDILYIFLASSIGIGLFLYAKSLGSYRHGGYLFFVFLMSAWMYRSAGTGERTQPPPAAGRRADGVFSAAVTALLLIHAVGGVNANLLDHRYVFSAARDAARCLASVSDDRTPIVGYPDSAASAVLGHLGAKSFYYPQGRRNGSFVRWDTDRSEAVDIRDVIALCRRTSDEGRRDVILVSNEPLGQDVPPGARFTLLESFENAVVRDESFFIYVFTPS